MKKLPVLLVLILALVSCKSTLGTEDKYPLSDTQKTPSTQISQKDKEGEQEEPLFGLPEQDQHMEEQTREPQGFPDSELISAEADYPEGVPEEASLPVPAEDPVAQQQPPPPSQAEEPPPPVSPPSPPPPQAEEPPVPPPPPPQAEEPPPPQQQDTPSIVTPDMPFQPVKIIPEPEENSLPYSRTVRALVGQFIEIPFRGSGWVYLGEFGSRRGVSYDSRRMDEEGMTFIFRAEAEGTYSLRFNRHDFIRDFILNDYVKVIVEQLPPSTGSSWSNPQIGPDRVYAVPRWPLETDPEGRSAQGQTPGDNSASGAAQSGVTQPATAGNAQSGTGAAGAAQSDPAAAASAQSGTGAATPGAAANAAAPGTSAGMALDTAQSMTEPGGAAIAEVIEAPVDWLKKAREEYNAGRIKGALDALDQFMILFPAGSDEAFWLYGQSLEANNEATRDIKLSLDYYRRLTREFPQSNRYDEARQRIVYLERFYFNIQ